MSLPAAVESRTRDRAGDFQLTSAEGTCAKALVLELTKTV